MMKCATDTSALSTVEVAAACHVRVHSRVNGDIGVYPAQVVSMMFHARALQGKTLSLSVRLPNFVSVCVVCGLQEKEYLFSMLVWHERLLYGSSSSSSSSEHHTAIQQLSEKLSHLGTNMRHMLSRKS